MTKLPPITENIRNTEGMPVFEIEYYEVAEWHPLPDGQGSPTQVHLMIHLKGVPYPLAMRLKSRNAAELLIGSLSRHARNVWPEFGN